MEVDTIARLQDLRIKILHKEPVSPEEMFQVLMDLRKGRRAAAESRSAKRKDSNPLPEDLNSLFDKTVEE